MMIIPLMFIFVAVIVAIVLLVKSGMSLGAGYRRDDTEIWVEDELKKRLPRNSYIIFGDLIIPSVSGKVQMTQIDHVIISPFGIFCLETKSHQGSIYGGLRWRIWKQYLGGKKFDLYSPILQNKHHVQSLEHLLRARLRAPIHSYVVFPQARSVKLDKKWHDLTLGATLERIRKHQRNVYTLGDMEVIAKGLAIASSYSGSPSLRQEHTKEVQAYIATHGR